MAATAHGPQTKPPLQLAAIFGTYINFLLLDLWEQVDRIKVIPFL